MQFNEVIEECHQERMLKEWLNRISTTSNCDYEYALFSIYCRMNEIEPTEYNFKKYIKTENKNFDFWENKYIYETYFGYEFSYEYINNKYINENGEEHSELTVKWHSIKK